MHHQISNQVEYRRVDDPLSRSLTTNTIQFLVQRTVSCGNYRRIEFTLISLTVLFSQITVDRGVFN